MLRWWTAFLRGMRWATQDYTAEQWRLSRATAAPLTLLLLAGMVLAVLEPWGPETLLWIALAFPVAAFGILLGSLWWWKRRGRDPPED